eukprot:3753663-Rhodomonas_salina.1
MDQRILNAKLRVILISITVSASQGIAIARLHQYRTAHSKRHSARSVPAAMLLPVQMLRPAPVPDVLCCYSYEGYTAAHTEAMLLLVPAASEC